MLTASAVKKYVFYLVHIFLILLVLSVYGFSRFPAKVADTQPRVLGADTTVQLVSDATIEVQSPSGDGYIASTVIDAIESNVYNSSLTPTSGSSQQESLQPVTLPNTGSSIQSQSFYIGLSIVLISSSILIHQRKTGIKIKQKKPQINHYLFNTTTTSCQTF
jgi:LPXTG-motif cell wall-anchored protein